LESGAECGVASLDGSHAGIAASRGWLRASLGVKLEFVAKLLPFMIV
jgi:hypothetical protein